MPHDSDIVTIVRKAPVFSAVADKPLREFLHLCQTVKFAPDQLVFRAGQPADRFYLVLAGQVKIFKLSSRGDEQILHLYGTGETFGEAAMWGGGKYPAHAQPLEPCRLLVVWRDRLREALTHNGELAMGMLAGLSAKLREFATLIEQLSLKEVPARLAGVLLHQARKAGSNTFRLAQSKRELASQIGTVAETLSRAFGKLRSAGIVQVDGSQIRILDMDALIEASEA